MKVIILPTNIDEERQQGLSSLYVSYPVHVRSKEQVYLHSFIFLITFVTLVVVVVSMDVVKVLFEKKIYEWPNWFGTQTTSEILTWQISIQGIGSSPTTRSRRELLK